LGIRGSSALYWLGRDGIERLILFGSLLVVLTEFGH
jgi:hypothetical protein